MKAVLLKHYRAPESHRELVKYLFLGSIPAASDSAGLGRSIRICISNKLAGDVDAVGA